MTQFKIGTIFRGCGQAGSNIEVIRRGNLQLFSDLKNLAKQNRTFSIDLATLSFLRNANAWIHATDTLLRLKLRKRQKPLTSSENVDIQELHLRNEMLKNQLRHFRGAKHKYTIEFKEVWNRQMVGLQEILLHRGFPNIHES